MSLVPPLLLAFALTCLPHAAHADTIIDIFDPADVLIDDGVGNDQGGSCIGFNDTADDALDNVSGLLNSRCTTLSFSHYLIGFSNPPSTLIDALLTLYFYDDNNGPGNSDEDGQPEQFDLALADALLVNGGTISEASHIGALSAAGAYSVVAYLQPNGVLDVLLSWDQGDFTFAKSELFGEWQASSNSNAVDERELPEPAELLLFGAGLMAVARISRRRR